MPHDMQVPSPVDFGGKKQIVSSGVLDLEEVGIKVDKKHYLIKLFGICMDRLGKSPQKNKKKQRLSI